VVGKGIGENFIAPDPLALRLVTDRFIFLEEGDLVEIRREGLDVWNVHDESVVRATVRVELGIDDVDRGSYRHFMQKEIHQQPRVLRDTPEGRIGRTRVLEEAFGLGAGEIFDRTRTVSIVAWGTVVPLPAVHRVLAPIVYVVPLQLLAYHVAVLKGTDVDQPRNLAKSVTVE